jgi:hypothetical protein
MRDWVLNILKYNPDFVTRVKLNMIDPAANTRDLRGSFTQYLSSSSSQTGRGIGQQANASERKQQQKKATARKSWASKYT